jgi:hypothetical protein
VESQVIFRDYQEQQAQDHNDLQDYARRSLDHLVLDAVTAERRYAGFNVTKTGQTEIQIEPGRMYDVLGVVHARNTTTTQSMVSYLASALRRYVLLTAVGQEVETDVEERDFIIDANTGATEPRAISTTSARTAVLTFTAGTESGDPVVPATPVGQVAIAQILVDPTQVVSVTMIEANEVTSTDNLDLRTNAIEAFDAIIGPKVAALAADLADLRNKIALLGNSRLLIAVAQDVARVKATLRYNVSGAVDYQTDWYLDEYYSDKDDSHSLGYDCLVEEGLRFGYANMDEFEISLLSANDPNAAFANGVLLPKYTEILRLATTQKMTPDSTLGMAQYGYQTLAMRQGQMSRSRLRYGSSFDVCSNGMRWNENDFWGSSAYLQNTYFNPVSQLYDDATGVTSTRLTTLGAQIYGPASYGQIEGMAYEHSRYDYYWFDSWTEPFLYSVTIDSSINGAFIAQTFLVPNDVWATSVRVYISAKGANEDITLAITELNAGVPDTERVMVKVAYPQANIVVGWNSIPIPATFLRKGKKYAVCLISNANHQVGMVSGQTYLDGTFFYSTDGIYYQGDLTKDLMMQVWGAYFNNSQVTIEFAPINLDGGFRNIDILAAMWVPNSAHIYWEVRPNGTGEWQPLVADNADVLAVAPPLAQFRARFDGSRDMHGAITLTGSRVRVWRPKLTFTHISEGLTLASGCTTVKVTTVLEHFDETPHDHTCILKTGATYATTENPDTTVTKLLDAGAKRYEREYTFNVAPAITQFLAVQTGTTNSAQNTFHVAERTMLGTA